MLVAKLEVVPQRVVMVARVEVRFVNTADSAVRSEEKKLVVVALVREALSAFKLVIVDEAEVVVAKVVVDEKLAG